MRGGEQSAVKVARVITRLNVGGPSRHVRILHERLGEHGFECSLFTGSTGAQEGSLEFGGSKQNIHKISSLQRALSPARDSSALRALTRRFVESAPAIVHTHMAKAGALGRLAAHRTGVPLIIHTYHGHVLDGYFSKASALLFTATERWLATKSQALLAVSTAIRDQLLELGIGRPDQWHVVPVGLDLNSFLNYKESQGGSRRSMHLPADGPVIGIVGRIAPIKDLETFVEAAARVLAARPDATFVIAGDGPSRQKIEAIATRTLGDRAKFLGWVTDLPALYNSLDAVVLTSRNEGTPVALIEAAASRRATVATRVGGVEDVVLDGKTGRVVPPEDPNAIAGAVLSLLENPAQATAMGESGRQWVSGRFSADRLVDDVTMLYRDLLNRPGKAPRSARQTIPPSL